MNGAIYGRIYCATNKVNGKRYVGQTVLQIKDRWRQHCKQMKSNAARRLIHKAIAKYGLEAFVVEEIATAESKTALNERERQCIEMLDTIAPSGYNLQRGGEGGRWHPESVEKLRRTKLAFWSDDKNKKKMLAIMVRDDVMRKRNETILRNWTEERRHAFGEQQRARHTEATRAAVGARTKEAWSRPGAKEKLSNTLRELRNRPEERAKLSAQRKADWAKPGYKEKHAAAYASVRQSQEYKAKMSASLKAKCADREWMSRRMVAIAEARKRKKEQQEVA